MLRDILNLARVPIIGAALISAVVNSYFNRKNEEEIAKQIESRRQATSGTEKTTENTLKSIETSYTAIKSQEENKRKEYENDLSLMATRAKSCIEFGEKSGRQASDDKSVTALFEKTAEAQKEINEPEKPQGGGRLRRAYERAVTKGAAAVQGLNKGKEEGKNTPGLGD